MSADDREVLEILLVESKKTYIKPEIVHEMLLETRAGTVILPVIPPGAFPQTHP